MANNFTVFEAAVSALAANSQALSVSSQNIANANTPGYSRQRIVFSSARAQRIGQVELGRGVNVKEVRRISDSFAELRLRDAYTAAAEADASTENLQQIDTLFNELGADGLSAFITDFFNSFQDVANDPAASAPRQNLLNKASIMINRFNELATKLHQSRVLIDQDINDKIKKINALAIEIEAINIDIQSAGDSSLVLKDERLVKVNELAELVDVSVVESGDSTFQVYIGDGLLLVSAKGHAVLSTQQDVGNDGLSDIMYTVGVGAPQDIGSRINGGALHALLDVRDTKIPSYQLQLDELAYEIATEVNTVHSTGYNLNSATSIDLFGTLGAIADSSTNIALSAAVLNNPDAIAAASSAANVPGGNSIAISLAALQSNSITFTGGTATFNSFMGDLLSDVGVDSQTAANTASFTANVFRQAQIQRERISGVSMEEEQLDLIRYQAAFQASAQLVSVAQQILGLLVELGR